ncbi:hypothetical protein BC827DRAFT_1164158 [Russula dissimulans]|nr:hypothetical protein BC827DRAFT_1164158 [Russula dissimulans]
MIPTPSSSRSWWSRSSVLSKSSSSSSKQHPFSQPSKFSSSKKFSAIATAIGLRHKKSVEEPPSPVLPLHTGDIESPPRLSKSVSKTVSVAVGWSDPRALPPEEFLDAYPQSVFSTDLDPFAAAAKYPDGPPDVSDPHRFSTFSEASTAESQLRRDAPHTHNRMSFASSSSLSHQRSDVTSDSSPISSPLLSPVMSGSHLSRLTVDCERILMREQLPSSPVSPQSLRGLWDDRSHLAASPSSTTLTDAHSKSTIVARPRTRSRGYLDAGHSQTAPSVSDPNLSSAPPTGPRVVIRQPSSTRLQPLRPPTAPPAFELPPAPGDVRPREISLLPAFIEHTPQSATSSSSSLSFASSVSSKLAVLESEGRHRDVRRLKDARNSSRSRPSSSLKDVTRGVHNSPPTPSDSRREFSPTRSLKKAISIQNMPKRSPGNSTSPSLPAAEDTKTVKKQRSFHHSRIPMPPFPASLKHAGPSNSVAGREALPVSDGRKVNVQSSQKSPLSSPVLSPTNVRKRLASLGRSTSSQTPEPDDDTPSIFSLSSTASPLHRPHTAVPINRSSVSSKPPLSSFWDDETTHNPAPANESRDLGPQHILSAADILKFENMVRDGENLNEFARSREDSITSLTTSKRSVRTAHEPTSTVTLSPPPPVTRQFDFLERESSKSPAPSRQRTRGQSLQGPVGDATNGRPQTGVTSLGQAVRSLSFQSLPGLPLRQRSRPTTASGASCPTIEDAPSLTSGNRSSVIALMPLSPPPVRRNFARNTLDHPSITPILRPGVSRTPSFLDMRDDGDRELPPTEDSFLDMGKASLDTVRSSVEEDPILT